MKANFSRFTFYFLILIIFSVLILPAYAEDLKIGQKAKGFYLQSITGEDIYLSDLLKGQNIIVLNFWATKAIPVVVATPTPKRTPTVIATPFPISRSTPTPNSQSPIPDIEMVSIPAGNFTMGSNDGDADEKPVHTVYLDSYQISKYEVTNAQYRAFCNATGRSFPEAPSWGIKNNHPVVNVDWNDAKAFCTWAGGRLPTEAEWEKAARGTDRRKYPWGNANPNGTLLNFCDVNCEYDWKNSSTNDGYKYTAPVGSYPSGVSPYGVMDMAGNVWEWCSDWYGDNYYSSSPNSNPQGPGSGSYRVNRGGSWYYIADNVRCAIRNDDTPSSRDDILGLRLVMDR